MISQFKKAAHHRILISHSADILLALMIITQLRDCEIRKELLVRQKCNKQKDSGLFKLGRVWIHSYDVHFYFKSALS